MSPSHADALDPSQLDPLQYLAGLNGDLSPASRWEHYQVLRPALLRLQHEQPAAFDVAVGTISRRLGIKAKTVLQDLATLTPPATARALLDAMGQTRVLRLAQDFVDGQLWFGVIAGAEVLLLNSARELLTTDQLPKELTVKDHGFDRCRLSKEAILQGPLSVSQGEVRLTPTELDGLLKVRLGWERLSTKEQGKVVKAYHLDAQELAELRERYLASSATEDEHP